MSLDNPRSLAALNDLLLIKSIVPRPARSDELSSLGSADTIAAEMASPLWAFDIALDHYEYNAGRQLQARINSLQGPMQNFLLSPSLHAFPQSDPSGAILDDSEVTIAGIGEDFNAISFAGLPAGYQLTIGDFFDVTFASTRRGFFELSASGAANGEGTTDLLPIFPHVWPGMAEGDAVSFARPAAKVFIMPGAQPGRFQHPNFDGVTFTAMQRL